MEKKLADDHGMQALGPKPVLQQSYAMKLMSDEKIWLAMLEDRNQTSHTYKQDLADLIYDNIKIYAPFLRKEFAHLMNNTTN